MNLKESWWLTDQYKFEASIPSPLNALAGPNDVAIVRAWPSGMTSEGWGLTAKNGGLGFMPRYQRGDFLPKRHLYGYDRDNWHIAYVMRSLNVVCFDIDGKNGGIPAAEALFGNVPLTLAETSKSGTGFHLFFQTDDVWSSNFGFGMFGDSIGIVQGVDVRGTGCVYHHKQQRWNGRDIAPLPDYLRKVLEERAQKHAATIAATAAISTLDDMEKLLMQDDMLTELAKPIPAGKRNNTLFAIGSKLKAAEVENWEGKLKDRAVQVGLSHQEADKLVHNISTYGG